MQPNKIYILRINFNFIWKNHLHHFFISTRPFKRSKWQWSSGRMVKRDPDAPKINCCSIFLLMIFSQHCSLIHIRMLRREKRKRKGWQNYKFLTSWSILWTKKQVFNNTQKLSYFLSNSTFIICKVFHIFPFHFQLLTPAQFLSQCWWCHSRLQQEVRPTLLSVLYQISTYLKLCPLSRATFPLLWSYFYQRPTFPSVL